MRGVHLLGTRRARVSCGQNQGLACGDPGTRFLQADHKCLTPSSSIAKTCLKTLYF